MVNEAHIAYNRDNYGYTPPLYGDYVSKNLGIVNANINQETSGGALIGGWKGRPRIHRRLRPVCGSAEHFEVTDSLSWAKGQHFFKYGGTWLRRQVEYFNPQEGKGYFWIDQARSTSPATKFPNCWPAAWINTRLAHSPVTFANIGQEDGIFAQDDWHIKRRLTLNLGIRWDLLTRPYEAHNQQSSFDREQRNCPACRQERRAEEHRPPGLPRLRPTYWICL
jgi:outer membrane receptor protein involved in Fe transport